MTYTQDPDANLPYAVDWAEFMATLDGDTIATAQVVAPAGITVEDEGLSGLQHVFLVSGGTAGRAYTITSRIATTAGVRNDASIVVRVMEG